MNAYDREQVLDARYDASRDLDADDFLTDASHPVDCDCERCEEDRTLF